MATQALANLIDVFPDPLLLVDIHGEILTANRPALKMLGMLAAQLINKKLTSLNGFSQEQLNTCLKPCSRSVRPLLVPLKLKHALTQEIISTRACRFKPFDSCPSPSILIYLEKTNTININLVELKHQIDKQKLDIKKLNTKNEELRISKEKYSVTLNSIHDAVIATDQFAVINYMNPMAEKLTGWLEKDAYGKPLDEVLHLIDEGSKSKSNTSVIKELQQTQVLTLAKNNILISKQGEEFFIEDSASAIRSVSGEVLGIVVVFKDITQERSDRKLIHYYATHDSLTGLVNRRELDTQIESILSSQSDASKLNQHSICYFDLDQFKIVNDSCGHAAGDELLKQISQIIKQSVRASDTVSRIGGDEFAVLMKSCDLESALKTCKKLADTISAYHFVHKTQLFKVTASFGVAPILAYFSCADEVMNAVDTACYLAKQNGRNRIEVYEHDRDELSQQKDEALWVPTITKALEENRFILFAQLILPIHAEVTCHFEILTRMIADDDSLIAPEVFLPSAERYGLVSKIDCWVISNTFELLNKHPHFLDTICTCSINLSGASLTSTTVLTLIEEKLAQYPNIQASKICFEITETAAISNLTKAQNFIKTISNLGCQFALDDFGSGLSSFAYLKNLKVNYLKIDGVFVKDVESDALDRAMVKSINEIGQLMGMKTIAEFVENDNIKSIVSDIGVDYVQGYGIHKPQALIDLIDEWKPLYTETIDKV